MNIVAEKKKLINELSGIEDLHLIKAIKELIAYSKSAKSEVTLKPFIQTELIARINKSEDDIKNGRVISLKQIRKELKSWWRT